MKKKYVKNKIKKSVKKIKNLNNKLNKIKYSVYIYDLLDKCFKKINKESEKFNKKDKDFIYNNLFDFFIGFNSLKKIYFKNFMDVINLEIKYLIPISLILSTKYLNNLNTNYFKDYEARGQRTFIKTNPNEKNKIDKVYRLKIRDEEKNKNINMNLARFFMGKNIIPYKNSKSYNKIYKKILYTRDNSYSSANILIENIIQNICYKVNNNIVLKIEDIIFYKRVCKIKMEKVNGYELLRMIDTNNYTKDINFLKTKQLVQNNFSKILYILFRNLKTLQDEVNFIHGDFHFSNIMINKKAIKNNNFESKNIIKILDFELSSVCIPMINKNTKKIELKYIKNYQDNNEYFWNNKYINPFVNPYWSKITDNLKLFITILFGDNADFDSSIELKKYKLNNKIEKLIVEKLGIIEKYRERFDLFKKYLIDYLSKMKMNPVILKNGKKHFQHHYLFMHIYFNLNHQMRNYVFFNTIKNKKYNDLDLSYYEFEKLIEINDKNYIQPSFINDPLAYRFTSEYLIKVFY